MCAVPAFKHRSSRLGLADRLLLTSALAGVALLGSSARASAVTILTVSDATTLASALATVNANPGTAYQLNIVAPVTLLAANAISTSTAVNLAGGGSLDINNFTQSIGALSGSGTLQLGSNGLVFGNDNSSSTLAATVHGSGGNGVLVKTGTGTTTLSSMNMDSGEFHLSNGAVVQTSGASAVRYTAVGSGSGANATMTLSGGSYTVSNALQVGDFSGVGVFNQTGGTLTLDGSLNVGNQGGTGTYNMSGGTLTLHSGLYDIGRNSGTNPTSHGTMNVSGGLVDVQGGSFILGDRVAPSSGTPSSGIVVQTGGTMQIGAGAALFLSAYGNGEYDLNGGTLAVGGSNLRANYQGSGAYVFKLGGGTVQSYGSALTATVDATLTSGTVSAFDTNGLGMTWSGNLSGGGGLNKTGSGTLALSGTNSYTGGTTISAGTLQLGSAAALPSGKAVTINGGTLDLNGNSISIGGLSGTGGSVVLGASALSIGTDNSSTSYAGAFSGTGTVTKSGSGTFTLTGSSAGFAGHTVIAGGGMAFSSGASLGGSLTVNSGASVSGTGTIGGNYTQNSGSTFIVSATPSSATSLTVGGVASLAGALSVQAASGTYNAATTYQILTATSVTGTFASLSSNFAFLTPSLAYSATAVTLSFSGNSANFVDFAGSSNQRSVGAALDKLRQSNPPALSSFFSAVLGQSSAQVTDTIAHIGTSAQIASVANGVSLDTGQRFASSMLEAPALATSGGQGALARASRIQFASTDPLDLLAQTAALREQPVESRWGSWASGTGVTGSISGDGNANGASYTVAGGAFGIDYRLSPGVLVGASLGYANTDATLSQASASSTVESTSFGLYGGYRDGPIRVTGSVGYAYNDQSLKRTVAVAGLATTTATATPHADQFLTAGEVGYDLKGPAGFVITPLVGFQATVINQDSYTEGGAGALNLSVGATSASSLRSIAGAHIEKKIALTDAHALDVEAKLAWAHEVTGDNGAVTAQFAAAPGTGFTVSGTKRPPDSALIELGTSAPLSKDVSLFVRYGGDLNGSNDAHSVSGGVRLTW